MHAVSATPSPHPQVNKPYLPLASGELSLQNAIYIVLGCTFGSLAIGITSGSPPLIATLVISLILGEFCCEPKDCYYPMPAD